jgi:hypothetical protein
MHAVCMHWQCFAAVTRFVSSALQLLIDRYLAGASKLMHGLVNKCIAFAALYRQYPRTAYYDVSYSVTAFIKRVV